MHFKLLLAFSDDTKTDAILKAARAAGATGATVINNARGEGLNEPKTFFGLALDTQRDMLLFLVEEHMARPILETIAEAGEFDWPHRPAVARPPWEDDVTWYPAAPSAGPACT